MRLVVLSLLLFASACATQVAARGPADVDRSEFYDPLAEWAGPKTRKATAPVRPARPPAPPLEIEPPPQLRAFTDSEMARIRSVQHHVRAAAQEHGLPPDLVNGIIWVESKFDIGARSHVSARGLMQLMPRTGQEVAKRLGRRYKPFDAEFNIHAGTHYFALMLRRYDGNMTLALAAYNIGPGVVDRWIAANTPLPEGSQRYVDNVFTAARAFRSREP